MSGKNDNIVATGFDQSIALLEKSDSVHCVDIEEDQIQYGMFLKDLIEKGKFDEFLGQMNRTDDFADVYKAEYVLRNGYFSSDNERLDRIREKVKNLTLEKGDISDAIKRGGFNKAYLSNVVGCFGTGYDLLVKLMNVLDEKIPEGGLVYASNKRAFEGFRQEAIKKNDIKDSFVIDTCLTNKSDEIQKVDDNYIMSIKKSNYGWDPVIYAKSSK